MIYCKVPCAKHRWTDSANANYQQNTFSSFTWTKNSWYEIPPFDNDIYLNISIKLRNSKTFFPLENTKSVETNHLICPSETSRFKLALIFYTGSSSHKCNIPWDVIAFCWRNCRMKASISRYFVVPQNMISSSFITN